MTVVNSITERLLTTQWPMLDWLFTGLETRWLWECWNVCF